MATVLDRAIGWLLCTGNIYFMVYWNAEDGEILSLTTAHETPEGETVEGVPADENGEARLTADGMPDMEAEPHRVQQGEIATAIVSPMCVRFNPDAESPDDANEWFVGEIMPVGQAAKLLGKTEDELGGGGDEELSTMQDLIAAASAGSRNDGFNTGGSDNSESKGKRCLVLRYYGKPCADYPEGRHWISVDEKMVLSERELPYGFWPPLVAIQDIPVPGQALAMGVIGQIVPLNEKYNTLDAKIKEHNVNMAMGGKWIVSPEDQNLAIDSDPGQKLVSRGYQAGRPPVQAEVKTLPPGIYQERENALNELTMVSGLGELGLSKKPEGVSSGRGFLVLQEQVDSVLTPTLIQVEIGLEEIAKRQLRLAQKYYREDRTLKIRGQNGQWEFQSFKGSDLVDGMDVEVEVGSSFPWSKSARQDMALQMVQSIPALVMNADGATVNTAKLARYLNVGGIEAFESEQDPDQDEIDHEHADFAFPKQDENGVPIYPEIGWWQDHAAHWAGHAAFMKRDRGRFERWPPESQEAFKQHCLKTQAAIAEGLAQMTPPEPMVPPEAGNGAAPPGGPPQLSVSSGGGTTGQSPALAPSDFASANS